MGGSSKPQPAPVPTADPIAVQAQFEAGADDKDSELTKKAQGKKSLVVGRKMGQSGLAVGSAPTSAGLAVGAK